MAETTKTFSTLTVDLSEVKTVEALHVALKEAFEFPEYYGGNLDALHDCLTDIAVKATEAEPITVTAQGKDGQEGYKHMIDLLKKYAPKAILG